MVRHSAQVALLGVPFDAYSSFLRGASQAPAAVRQVMLSGASNMTAENGYVLDGEHGWRDAGDVACDNSKEDFDRISVRVSELLAAGEKVLSLGGDHSITYPILQAYARAYPGLCILHLDAHPDLYDELDGNRLSHACPFARIMEDQLAKRLVQVGIRTLNAHQAEQAERFGVTMHEARNWKPETSLGLHGPLYLSIDLDVLDPAFAPGVSHHEPGGLSVRDVIGLIQSIGTPLVGADIVEYNPQRDINGMTAAVCLKLIKEVSAAMAMSAPGQDAAESRG
ncbi:MAG: agmatinase [Gammaproteobacteria bacterium]|nr:agmatinase [Gammaproteobacteria bacterium]